MIKGKYCLVENSKNVFEIFESQAHENGVIESTVMTEDNLAKSDPFIVGCLREQRKSCLHLKSHHVIDKLELFLYDQQLSIASSNTKKCCWRCQNQLKVINNKKALIGTITRLNTCSLSCARQVYVQIRDGNDEVAFSILSHCCQIGNIIPDCCGFLRCGKPIVYEIENNEGKIVGNIENIVNSSCGISRKFNLDMSSEGLDARKKILLINSITLLL